MLELAAINLPSYRDGKSATTTAIYEYMIDQLLIKKANTVHTNDGKLSNAVIRALAKIIGKAHFDFFCRVLQISAANEGLPVGNYFQQMLDNPSLKQAAMERLKQSGVDEKMQDLNAEEMRHNQKLYAVTYANPLKNGVVSFADQAECDNYILIFRQLAAQASRGVINPRVTCIADLNAQQVFLISLF